MHVCMYVLSEQIRGLFLLKIFKGRLSCLLTSLLTSGSSW